MQDKTINSALLALRKRIIREHRAKLAHVNALLLAQGVDPDGQIIRAKRRPDVAGQGMMRLMLIEALKDGPLRVPELASVIGDRRPELDRDAAYKRTALSLSRMYKAGLVRREGRLWSLV